MSARLHLQDKIVETIFIRNALLIISLGFPLYIQNSGPHQDSSHHRNDYNGYFIYRGERYKILKAQISPNKDQPGKVISNDLEISCGENSLKILEIQREGKKPQKINEFTLGSQIKKGTNLFNV